MGGLCQAAASCAKFEGAPRAPRGVLQAEPRAPRPYCQPLPCRARAAPHPLPACSTLRERPPAMTTLAAFPSRLSAASTHLRRPAAAAQARPRLTSRPPLHAAAAARRPRLPAAAPDDPRHFGQFEQQEEEEEEDSSDAEEFDTIAGAVEVVDEDEAEVGAALCGGGWDSAPTSVCQISPFASICCCCHPTQLAGAKSLPSKLPLASPNRRSTCLARARAATCTLPAAMRTTGRRCVAVSTTCWASGVLLDGWWICLCGWLAGEQAVAAQLAVPMCSASLAAAPACSR